MTSGVGIVGAATGVVVPPAAAVQATQQASAPATVAAPIQNPKVVLDPSAGFITEHLSANGDEIVSQTPSARIVAYLQQGLTADGTVKPRASESVGKTA